MATGQVGFHRQKQVKRILVEKRANEIINRLNKTKEERFPDLAAERAAFDKEEKRKEKAALLEKVPPPLNCARTKRAQRKEEERVAKEKQDKEAKERKNYEDMYGDAAKRQVEEDRGDDYDPEEDFW
jgi:hypothetical protein